MSYIQPSYGLFLGELSYCTNTPETFWSIRAPGISILLIFLEKFAIVNNIYFDNKSKYASSNGTFCQIAENYVDSKIIILVLPSGKEKIISSLKFGMLGRCNNYEHNETNPGKAGHLKTIGIKSKVRGVAKNPVDHPHGGRTKTNKPEVSPWGWVAKHNK